MRLFKLIFFKTCSVSIEFLESVFCKRADKIYFCKVLVLLVLWHTGGSRNSVYGVCRLF